MPKIMKSEGIFNYIFFSNAASGTLTEAFLFWPQ